MLRRYPEKILLAALYLRLRLDRRRMLGRLLRSVTPCKVYYGCGEIAQPGYVNVDIRYTPAVDLLADLAWCRRKLRGTCCEVYLSHVLEHYAYPGRAMRRGKGTVTYALASIFEMLHPGGLIRLAVPDYAKLCALYLDGTIPLYPRISGRLCGEQDYPENLHKCMFDKVFLEYCLVDTGFIRVRDWSPYDLTLVRDGSFDALQGSATSLNLLAEKPGSI